jgi:lipopolysaccharide export system protein LptA
MFSQAYNSYIATLAKWPLMRLTPSIVAIALAFILTSVVIFPVNAEKADSEKPLTIEADRLDHDDIQQVSIYNGRVVLTKGTILLQGDKLVLRKDPEGYQYGTITGKPASFRQKREGVDEFIEGYGLEINYNDKNEVVRFVEKAYVRKLEKAKVASEIQGKIVRYDSRNETFSVESGSPKETTTTTTKPASERVRVVIQPKATDGSTAAKPSASTGEGVKLQPETKLK